MDQQSGILPLMQEPLEWRVIGYMFCLRFHTMGRHLMLGWQPSIQAKQQHHFVLDFPHRIAYQRA